MPTIGRIVCSTCQILYPKARFTASRMNKNGVTGICKKCVRAMSAQDTQTGLTILNRRLSRNMAVNTKRYNLLMARVCDFEKRQKTSPIPTVLNRRVSRHAAASMKRHDRLMEQIDDFEKRQNILMTHVQGLEKQIQKLQQSQSRNQPPSSCLPVGLQGGVYVKDSRRDIGVV